VRLSLACAVAILAVWASPASAERVAEIVVEENTKTTDETVILIADLEVGDDWSGDVAERVKQDMVSSGLFKHVDVWWEQVKGGLRIHLVARDKHSWVVAPAFYNQPTNKGGGAGFGENNLFGENKKLLLYLQVATGDSFLVGAYVDPSIAGTRFHWQYDLFLKSGRVIEYASPTEWRDDPKAVRESRLNYLNQGVRVGMSLWRTLSLDVRLRGAWVSYSWHKLAEGAVPEDVTGDPAVTDIPAPGDEGWDVSTEATLGIDTRANWYGLSEGYRFSLSYERALPDLGSDFDYRYTTLRLERHIRFLERHNFILKGSAGYGEDMPFHQEYQAGGTSMRGWKNSQFRGDLRFTGNVEYSVPVVTISGVALRGVAFWDSAYTTFLDTESEVRNYLPDAEARGLEPLKNSVGAGARLYMRQIVLPLLGIDVGYGLERNDYEIYLAIGLTD
jgi:outer membrane protein insertion porin family